MTSSSRDTAHRSFAQRWLQRPKQLWLRRALFQVHLWTGLVFALYIVVIGVSGSILVFKEELLPRPHVAVARMDLRGCTADQLARAISAANSALPGYTAYLASCPDEADPLFSVSMRAQIATGGGLRSARHGSLTAYVDPVTGRVAGHTDTQDSWVQWVDNLHVYLLAGRNGERWNGVGAAALLLMVLTGAVLWWPGVRRWTHALVLDFRRNWRRINWDLHTVVGIWTLVFTLTWATTGVYFAWPRLFNAAVNAVSPVRTAGYPSAQLAAASAAAHSSARFDLLTTLREAEKQSPGAALEGCFYAFGPHGVFTVYMARGRMGDYANTDFVYFDQTTGQHLYTWHRGENATLGDWLVWLTTPLHFGTSWGVWFKILWAMLGMTLPLLTVTGALMYWNRYLRRRLGSMMRRQEPGMTRIP